MKAKEFTKEIITTFSQIALIINICAIASILHVFISPRQGDGGFVILLAIPLLFILLPINLALHFGSKSLCFQTDEEISNLDNDSPTSDTTVQPSHAADPPELKDFVNFFKKLFKPSE